MSLYLNLRRVLKYLCSHWRFVCVTRGIVAGHLYANVLLCRHRRHSGDAGAAATATPGPGAGITNHGTRRRPRQMTDASSRTCTVVDEHRTCRRQLSALGTGGVQLRPTAPLTGAAADAAAAAAADTPTRPPSFIRARSEDKVADQERSAIVRAFV
jgi:hypothetical protein